LGKKWDNIWKKIIINMNEINKLNTLGKIIFEWNIMDEMKKYNGNRIIK